MNISVLALSALALVAVLGHVMASFWYLLSQFQSRLCQRKIYDLPFRKDQIKRELRNSIHAPMHAVILGTFYLLGFFHGNDIVSFFASFAATLLWAEIWHYASHRAFHLRPLHWIHLEHHLSNINSPFTAISFSFTEKLVFDLGLLGALGIVDFAYGLNVLGISAWYIVYLMINSFSHANFELKSARYNDLLGKFLTTTTYHSLHHSRYTGNYGLGTRLLDKLLNTEWSDYESLYQRVCSDEKPLTSLRERVEVPILMQHTVECSQFIPPA
jgi:Delta7-sterol 5-desaturase